MILRSATVLAVGALTLAAAGTPPQRIISTAPSITEMLYALGLGERVAGVTRFCDYPPDALKKPKIGDYINPNLEVIAALKPDLVIVQNNPVRLSERLRMLHLKTIEVNQQSIEGIYNSIAEIGKATDTEARARELTAEIKTRLDGIRKAAQRFPRTRGMFVVGRSQSRLDGLIVVGRSSYLNELIALAGGENVFSDAAAAYPGVSLEEVLARSPSVIIDMGGMGDRGEVTPAVSEKCPGSLAACAVPGCGP